MKIAVTCGDPANSYISRRGFHVTSNSAGCDRFGSRGCSADCWACASDEDTGHIIQAAESTTTLQNHRYPEHYEQAALAVVFFSNHQENPKENRYTSPPPPSNQLLLRDTPSCQPSPMRHLR